MPYNPRKHLEQKDIEEAEKIIRQTPEPKDYNIDDYLNRSENMNGTLMYRKWIPEANEFGWTPLKDVLFELITKETQTYEQWIGGGQRTGKAIKVKAIPLEAINRLFSIKENKDE